MLDPQVVDDVRYLVPADVSANKMVDPAYAEVAELQPGVCALCRNHRGPFIDTRVDTPWGRIYVCTATCGSQIATLCSSQVVDELRVHAADQDAVIAGLRDALEKSELSRVVPLQDVRRVVKAEQEAKRRKRRTKDRALTLRDVGTMTKDLAGEESA